MMKINAMKRILVITLLFCGCSVMPSLQKRKLISVFHLIETSRYAEAKKVVEEMTDDGETARWSRTWYARGLLCQTAYRDGMAKNDRKMYELYPDQLFVALDSYEMALSLDKNGRIEKSLPSKYIYLANEFQKSGGKHYEGKRYGEALRHYEQALRITLHPIMTVRVDTGLIHNTALAAYEAGEWNKAIRYLTRLHEYSYSPNVTHLLYLSHLARNDTTSARRTLSQGVRRYTDNELPVLLLADLLLKTDDHNGAVKVLDDAISKNPSGYIFHYTKGLVLQKAGLYAKAAETYKNAIPLTDDKLMIYFNMAACYFNIGIEIDENARSLTNNREVLEEKQKSSEAFRSASFWLEKAYDLKPDDKAVLLKMYQLSKALRIPVKAPAFEMHNK